MPGSAFVYILASRRNGTLYVGVTSDLRTRIEEHRRHALPGFTSKYGVTRLVWFEAGESIEGAIALEKMIKNRRRAWKLALIEGRNPRWRDLAEDWE